MKPADNDREGPSGGGVAFCNAANVPSVATPPVVSPKTKPNGPKKTQKFTKVYK